jgi:hypothetical protein
MPCPHLWQWNTAAASLIAVPLRQQGSHVGRPLAGSTCITSTPTWTRSEAVPISRTADMRELPSQPHRRGMGLLFAAFGGPQVTHPKAVYAAEQR